MFTFPKSFNSFWRPRILICYQPAFQMTHNATRLTQCTNSEVCNKHLINKLWPQSLFDAMHVSPNTKRYMLQWTLKLSKVSCWCFGNQKLLRWPQHTVEIWWWAKPCYIWYTGSFHLIFTHPALGQLFWPVRKTGERWSIRESWHICMCINNLRSGSICVSLWK